MDMTARRKASSLGVVFRCCSLMDIQIDFGNITQTGIKL
jgi:hypothetical protein